MTVSHGMCTLIHGARRCAPRSRLTGCGVTPSLRAEEVSAAMMRYGAVIILAAAAVALVSPARSEEMRPAVGRPDIMEVGDPILITRRVLGMEMRRNVDLRDW